MAGELSRPSGLGEGARLMRAGLDQLGIANWGQDVGDRLPGGQDGRLPLEMPPSGAPLVLNFFQGWAPEVLISTVASFSFLAHFNAITNGVIDLRDLTFFVSLIAVWLFATAVIVDVKKAG